MGPRQMPLDDPAHGLRPCLTVQVSEKCARIKHIGHHFSVRRSCCRSSVIEGQPANIAQVSSTSRSDTGRSRIMPSASVSATRPPGTIPSASRISAGITSCPFVLTVAIRFSMTYIVRKVRQQPEGKKQRKIAYVSHLILITGLPLLYQQFRPIIPVSPVIHKVGPPHIYPNVSPPTSYPVPSPSILSLEPAACISEPVLLGRPYRSPSSPPLSQPKLPPLQKNQSTPSTPWSSP